MFDQGWLTSKKYDLPVICIGNLTVGGTGKTPHTEYIISLLQDKWKIAVLSRGYKRKTKGFRLAGNNSNSFTIGDEPFQIHKKYPEVIVAVDEKRVHGMDELLKRFPDIEVVVLDDAYQHRYLQSGYYVLLADYSRLYVHDFYMPSGRLRESKKGSKRADMIIVTKCPGYLTETEMERIRKEIKPLKNQSLFFSSYQYSDLIPVFPECQYTLQKESLLNENTGILFMSGIVSPEPVIDYLKEYTSVIETLFFPDHHNYTEKDLGLLLKKYNSMNMKEKIIVVTEKDAAKLVALKYPEELKSKTFALPVKVKISDNKETLFTEKIQHYVKQNSRNG